MNPIESLKLSKSTKLFLFLWSLFVFFATVIIGPLLAKLIETSDNFQKLVKAKPIDALIGKAISINISTEPILIAVIILLLTWGVFLFYRMKLYYQAAEAFGKYFCEVSLKHSKITGSPVEVLFKNKKMVIDAKEYPNFIKEVSR